MLVSRCGGRARCVGVAVAFLVAGAAAGCARSTPAGAPPISAPAPAELRVAADLSAAEEATTPTTATTVTAEDDGGDARAHDALALIAFPWRRTLPNWSIRFLPARAGLRGLTRVDDRRIEIYVRDSDTTASLARIVAHELGHAVDVQLNSPSDRDRWRVLRGAGPSVAWWPGNSVSDFDTLAGDFAEAFASWLTGSVSQSRVAPQPGPVEFAMLADLVSTR